MSPSPPSRVWLVTGASSGFGLEATLYALERGDRVVATLRNPPVLADLTSKYSSAQLVLAKVDVTNHEDIKAAFAKAKEAFGRVDVVFNNAGHALAGEAETTPEDLARKVFEVDFWGAVRVSQEAVRFFREENKPQGGHLIQNSAAAGITAFPTLGFYVAAKHALEGFTGTLHQELNPAWNIKITSVEPGAFDTNVVSVSQLAPQHPAYAEEGSITAIVRKALIQSAQSWQGAKDTRKGVQKIYDLTLLPSPPLHLPLGQDAVTGIRRHIEALTKDVEDYAHWSQGLDK
ncbi:NAD(P)-binding protein [Fomes fomentarius]|nr:NAD(P)-binding protein [Fomes fomentarius]